MIPEFNNGLVSIILPVYNGQKFLKESIESCLAQTYKNIELIVVNDCSTDNSLQIAEDFIDKDSRVKVISNQINKKLPASLNIGHEAAKGEYFTWTSHDNSFVNNAIQVLLNEILESASDIVYSDFYIIEENGSRRKEINLINASPLLYGNSIGASFLYRRNVYKCNDGYNEKLHSVEDYDFWLRATLHSKFSHIEDSLYNFRSHETSLSSKLGIDNTPENKLFTENIKSSYRNYLKLLESKQDEKYAELLMRIHQYKEIDVLSFLRDYAAFEDLLRKITEKTEFLKFKELVEDLDIRIRANIQQYRSNQNFSILVTILKNRHELLWKYDRRNSLKIIQKCLK